MMLRFLLLVCIAVWAAPMAFANDKVADANNEFAFSLYQELRKQPGNLFFSPFSISTALSMTAVGARGDTAQEMQSVLRLEKLGAGAHAQIADLLSSVRDAAGEGVSINVANALWAQKSFPFSEAFKDTVKQHYQAGIQNLDFAQSEAARVTINDWVAEQTQERIQDLIAKGMITADTRLVLTNAVYFKGDWQLPFPESNTKQLEFFVQPTEAVQVPMMYMSARLALYESEELQVLELPYKRGELSMLVVLPRERDGLSAVEQKLSAEVINRWLAGLRPTKVLVWLPKFSTTQSFSLAGTLQALGMQSAFDADKADFSGMTGKKDLVVGQVLHKAFVEVSETGTEAAAATAVMMPLGAAMPTEQPPQFRGDHPFMFVIQHKPSGAILFVGRIEDPRT